MKTVDIKLVLLVQIIYQLRNVGSSYYSDPRSAPDQDYQTQEMNDSEEPTHSHHHHHYRRSGHRHKKNHVHDHDHDHDHDHSHSPSSKLRYGDSEEYEDCDCSCNKCDPPSDCCKGACKSCTDQYSQGRGGAGQSSLVFVPYPYPLIVPNPGPGTKTTPGTGTSSPRIQSDATSPTSPPTTPTVSTTSTEPPTLFPPESKLYLKSQNDNNMLESVLKSVVDDYSNIIVKTPEKQKNGNNKYMLTSLRRTKPTWMPKFGIVPISDNIAEKLMSQLRGVKGLSRRQKRFVNFNFSEDF